MASAGGIGRSTGTDREPEGAYSGNRESRDHELGLLDLVRPLVRHWKLAAAIFSLGLAAAGVLFVTSPVTYSAKIDFTTVPVSYAAYQDVLIQLGNKANRDAFFTEDRLGVDPPSYFIQRKKSGDNVEVYRYLEYSYPAPYISNNGVDVFKGYFDNQKRLVQSNQGDFSFAFSTRNGDRETALRIAAIIGEDYIPACWGKAQLERIITGELADTSDRAIDFTNLELQKDRLKGTVRLLEEFQKEYPSLIRSNLTLNDTMVPVEVQLMNARTQLKNIDDQIYQYHVGQARFLAWKNLSEAFRTQPFGAMDRKGLSSVIAETIAATSQAFTLDPGIAAKVSNPREVQAILDMERAALEDRFRNVSSLLQGGMQFKRVEFTADEKNDRKPLLVIVASLFLAMLSAYAVHLGGILKRQLAAEDEAEHPKAGADGMRKAP